VIRLSMCTSLAVRLMAFTSDEGCFNVLVRLGKIQSSRCDLVDRQEPDRLSCQPLDVCDRIAFSRWSCPSETGQPSELKRSARILRRSAS